MLESSKILMEEKKTYGSIKCETNKNEDRDSRYSYLQSSYQNRYQTLPPQRNEVDSSNMGFSIFGILMFICLFCLIIVYNLRVNSTNTTTAEFIQNLVQVSVERNSSVDQKTTNHTQVNTAIVLDSREVNPVENELGGDFNSSVYDKTLFLSAFYYTYIGVLWLSFRLQFWW